MPDSDASVKPWPAVSLAEAQARLTAPGAEFEIVERTIHGRPTRIWKNAPPTLRDIFIAGRGHGERTYLVYEDDRASYAAFSRAALAIAAALIADGIVKGDRVAVAMRNLPEWPAAFFGGILAGAVVVPLNAWWTGAELRYGLVDSGAKVALLDAERWQRLADHVGACPDLVRLYVSREAAPIGHPLVRHLESVTGAVNDWHRLPDRPLPAVEIAPEDDATIFYTSGTTGEPKGALGTHRNAATAVMAHPYSRARAFARRGEAMPQPVAGAPQKAQLLSIPAFHVTGCMANLLPSLYRGTKLVMMRRWDPELAMRLIERERCTNAGGVPTVAWQLIEHPARHDYDLSSLEAMSYGGAPAAGELVRRLGQALPAVVPATGWGMTETSATFTHVQGEDYCRRPDSCGPALPVCDMKIAGPDGEALPPGEVGELWARGPNIVKGYWNKPEATAESFIDGWVRSGDLARVDEDGFCYIVDRKKDMLIRGGENIYCIEVENVLYQHPAVMDAAVVPVPHRTLGEEPAGVVTLKPGAAASEADIRTFVGERLAAFKVPVRVVFWPEPLPRNPNGKILKSELKKYV